MHRACGLSRSDVQFDRAQLDDRLRERMELLQRWSRVIRHDLGNVVYPSRSLMEKAANEGEAGRKLGDRVRVLTEMMEANRAALAFLGPLNPSDSDAAVIAAEWWTHAKSLLRAVPNGSWTMTGPTRRDRALPISACGLTHLAFSVMIAVDLHAERGSGGAFDIDCDEIPTTSVRMTASGRFVQPPQLLDPIRRISDQLGASFEDEATVTSWTVRFAWE